MNPDDIREQLARFNEERARQLSGRFITTEERLRGLEYTGVGGDLDPEPDAFS